MDYREKKIVLFSYQFGVEQIGTSTKSQGTILMPSFVLQRTKISTAGERVHITQNGTKKPLLILPFFAGFYEKIMGDALGWKDPYLCFIGDLEVLLQKVDAVLWIFATPDDIKILRLHMIYLTCDFCVYNGIQEDSKLTLLEFSN